MAWKLYTTNRLRRTKGRKVTPVKKNGYYRLSFPHPMDGDYSTDEMTPPYAEKDNYGHGHEHLEFAGPTDPYHVVSTLDDSLIAKDEHFKHAKMPEPVLSDKRAEKPSALGFSPERTFTTSPLVSPRMETTGSFNTSQDSPVNTPRISSGQLGTFVNQHGPIVMPRPDNYVAFEATPPPVYIPNPRLDTV
ncbi:hypothetical protein BJ165DRAFT_1527410 [Panaeolus papilionaceus]|nr:hypothetical protein BJ165DRAFT_1527410 [Panaeolus papilionaceus]